MTNWIKGVMIVVGLFFTSLSHYFWRNKPQEEVADAIIVRVIKDQTGVDIDPIEEQVDDIQDFLE